MNSFASILKTCTSVLLLITSAITVNSQQSTGTLKGTVKDQLRALVVGASIVVKDGKHSERAITSDNNGNYEVRALPPGRYDLTITAPGFNSLEEKNVELRAGKTTTLDVELTIGALEQTVIVDNKGISTDADRNADAIVLRERELAALPDDPDALTAALQAMAGPGAGENGAQVKVDGFSNGTVPPKETIREVRINQNPYSAENEFPGWGGIEIFTQPGTDKFHGGGTFNFTDESLNSRNPFAKTRAPYQLRQFGGSLTGPLVKKRDSFTFYINRYANFANQIINATVLDPITLTPFLFPAAPKPAVQRPYSLVFSVYISNALNHTNASTPVGNMTSPFFLKSTSTSGFFFFGPGGGGGASGNRQVVARVRLSF